MRVTQNFLANYSPNLVREVLGLPIRSLRLRLAGAGHGSPEKISFGNHPRQYLLWYPASTEVSRRDTLIYFYHGGGWRLGRPGMFPSVSLFFQNMGFDMVMPAYRLAPRFAFPDMREDLDLALSVTKSRLDASSERPRKIIVAGMSAGATLAAHLAFDRAGLARLGFSEDIFAGFLSCGGPLDLEKMPDTFPVRQFTGGEHMSAAFQRANPMRHLADCPTLPTVLIHGTADSIVPYACSLSFFEKYRQLAPTELITLPGKFHLDALGWSHHDVGTAEKLANWLAQFA